jgi:hypothetical protein
MRPLRYLTPLIVTQPGDSSTQIDATPSEPTYPYPWDDECYGPALNIAGGGGHGGR